MVLAPSLEIETNKETTNAYIGICHKNLKVYRANNLPNIITCPAPTGLIVPNVGFTTATLSLKDASTNESGFKVFLNGNHVKTLPAKSGTGTTITATLTGLVPNTDYSIYIQSYNGQSSSNTPTITFKTAPVRIPNIVNTILYPLLLSDE